MFILYYSDLSICKTLQLISARKSETSIDVILH